MSDDKKKSKHKGPIIEVRHLSFFYGVKQALFDITMEVHRHEITALIGPSGCGKSTLLRCLNRMNDEIPNTHVQGTVLLQGEDIYSDGIDIVELRRRVGLVFQKPNPFPQSIFNNVAMGPRALGMMRGPELADWVHHLLHRVNLWDEIKGDTSLPALSLSLGQQQRLCIARTLAVKPEVVLMDEPCSALDPIATLNVEELMRDLRKEYTIVIVTHNMQQAARVSDRTAFFWLGELVEFAKTKQLFTRPAQQRTEDYISGRMG